MPYRKENQLYKEAVKAAEKFITHEDVNDIFWGTKYVDGEPTDELAIRFNVNKKKAKSKIKANQLLPKTIGNITTDITDFENTPQISQWEPTMPVRPVIGGLQIQSSLYQEDISEWGTIGGVIVKNGKRYGITNYHVLFDNKTPNFSNLPLINQPSFGNFGSNIGKATPYFNSNLDYALFEIHPGIRHDIHQSINGLLGIIDGYINPWDGLRIFKYGATTGKTFGIYDSRSIINKHVIAIRSDSVANNGRRISEPGDSGSLWVASKNSSPNNLKIVGLHCSGDESRNIAYATLYSSISSSMNNFFNSKNT